MDITYTSVSVVSPNEAFITSGIDQYLEQSPDHSLVLRWKSGKLAKLMADSAVVGVRILSDPLPKAFCVGVDGIVTVALMPGVTTETIDDSQDGPSNRVQVRCVEKIGDSLFVCGMARFVYQRSPGLPWRRIDQGVFLPREKRDRAAGFHALDGFGEQDLYAVGQYGEIWRRAQGNWRQEDSPTNVTLTRVVCAPTGDVYVAGMAGRLIRGNRQGAWQVLDHRATNEDFWGLAWFDDRLYAATEGAVFTLIGDELRPIDTGFAEPISTPYLGACPGAIWAVGPKNAAHSSDGVTWHRMVGPSP